MARESKRRDLSFPSRLPVKEWLLNTSLRSIPKSGQEKGTELALPSTSCVGIGWGEKETSGGGAPSAAGAEKAEETTGACFLELTN